MYRGYSNGTANPSGYDDDDDLEYKAGGQFSGGYQKAMSDRDFLRRNLTNFNSVRVGFEEKLSLRSHRDRKIVRIV